MLPWKVNICTAKVTISSSLFVDRTAKIKHLDDTSRTKVKILTNDLNKLGLRKLPVPKVFTLTDVGCATPIA